MAEEYNVPVNWVYEIHQSVPTNIEPIQTKFPNFNWLSLRWNFGWIDDAMNYLNMGSEWTGVFANANRMRPTYKSDWGITYFIVKNEITENFPDGSDGYTITFGENTFTETYRSPFAVSVFYQYNVSNFHSKTNKVIAHETLHLFGAADEYANPDQCKKADNCADKHGFLYHENENCDFCYDNIQCIMHGHLEGFFICDHTSRHIGWSDWNDNDNIPDAIDPNSSVWANLYFANPGQIVRIFTLDGDLIRNIAVTDNKLEYYPTGNVIHWDGLNYQSQEVYPLGLYYYTVDNQGPYSIGVNQSCATCNIPVVNSIIYSADTLRWEINNSFSNLDLQLWSVDECDDSILIARPQWNKFH